MTATRAVVFDMDGVLVLSGPAHWQAWRDTAAAHGRPMTHADFLLCNGLVNADICRLLFGDARATPAFVERIATIKEQAYRAAIADAVPLAPGCRELLATLRQARIAAAVGTSGPQENVDLVLDGGGIRPFFGGVVHAGLVRRGKPAPDIFLLAAEQLGVQPAQCVVVEDAPSGIRAAQAAGMRVIAVCTNHDAGELRELGADVVLPDLAAITLQHVLSR
ncbi:MAG: HAD family phosphatase [Planctomycetes bacterium]|nr:HAD family phosphatase [Planctomycetota bacterium]